MPGAGPRGSARSGPCPDVLRLPSRPGSCGCRVSCTRGRVRRRYRGQCSPRGACGGTRGAQHRCAEKLLPATWQRGPCLAPSQPRIAASSCDTACVVMPGCAASRLARLRESDGSLLAARRVWGLSRMGTRNFCSGMHGSGFTLLPRSCLS